MSDPLEPQWPDLVITAGARNEPVARWIQIQAKKRVRLVHIGRTWDPVKCFDLVITTPQYRLAERHNILQNTTTLHRVTQTRLEEARRTWAPRLNRLPRPYHAVVVGGNSGPYTFDRCAAIRLGREASALADQQGGSLLITTSARTPATATEILADSITVPHHFFRWQPDSSANPYYAYLALADAIIVTGDSISMLTEACATEKPVYIFDIGEGRYAMRKNPAQRRPISAWSRIRHFDPDWPRSFIYRLAMAIGPHRLTRDIRLVHRQLIESGRAVWLGDEFSERNLPPLTDLERAVARVRSLFEGPGEGPMDPASIRKPTSKTEGRTEGALPPATHR